jgi:hypothetical protein
METFNTSELFHLPYSGQSNFYHEKDHHNVIPMLTDYLNMAFQMGDNNSRRTKVMSWSDPETACGLQRISDYKKA